MFKLSHRLIATVAIIALAGCGGGNSSNYGGPAVPPLPSGGGLAQQSFVGIGDSLTFGEQSGGQLGDPTATSPVSGLPGGAVPVTQENGFWALMYAQLNGIALDPAHYNVTTKLGDPANSPLPLIKAPGLGSQLVVSAISPPFSGIQTGCNAFNQAAYSPTGWTTVRMNAATQTADVAIPGATMHEAATQTAPLTGPPATPSCNYVTIPGDPTSGGLQSLIQDESKLYYPVLGGFQQPLGPGKVTQLSAAVALKPALTTVWLGANDVLKFIFSHGQSPATDSPQQLAADLTTIVTTLQKAGSKVIVGNLPDILGDPSTGEIPVPQFFPQTKLSADLQALGVPAAAAAQLAAYVSATYTKGNGGFLTETGFFSLVSQVKANPAALPNLDPNGPGSGDGALYLDQTFAAQAIALNAGYNQAIGQVAASTGAALADIQTVLKGAAASGVPLAPGVTLTLQFGGGILSYDGLHPSNTGYALIANAFIGAADTKFGLTIPPLSNATIGAIASNDTYNPFVIKALNPAWPFPLP
jgi:lysophospholipase L1-like esterase